MSVPAGPRGGGNNNNGAGRLSPASLDLDTCGCPTTFGDPYCETWTEWTLEKTTESGPFTNPDEEPFSFTVTVTEGETKDMLVAEGTIRISNFGAQTPTLANVAVLLEDLTPGQGDAPGPSGNNWSVLAVAAENEHAACGNQAVTCDGIFDQTDGATLILYTCGGDPNNENDIIALSDGVEIPPATDEDNDGKTGEDPALDDLTGLDQNCWGIFDTDGDGLLDEDPGSAGEPGIDNDGDGAIDEDPIDGVDNDGDLFIDEDDPDDDGDGLVDEDGADDDGDGLIDEDDNCDDLVEICFIATFPASDVLPNSGAPGDGVVPSDDDLRIDLLVTFKGGGKRGGTCKLDVDCDGTIEDGKGSTDDEGEGHVRTVQQRHRFDPPDCTPLCDCVTLEDLGAYSLDPDCAVVDWTDTLDEIICAEGEGTVSEFFITGTVSCVCDPGAGDPNDPGNEPTVYTADSVPIDGGGLAGAVQATLRNDLSVGDGQRFCGAGVNGMGLCRDDNTDNQNCARTYISDLIPLDLSFSLYRMMVYDLGSAKRGLRMYTAIDHWDGDPQSFVSGCCGLSASFVTQDVMEYSVWGTNVDPADPAFMTMASWVKLSDVVGFDNSQAAIDAGGPFFSFDGDFGAGAAAPTVVYTQGGGGCGITNAYSRDYVFCNAYRYVGVRSSTISMLEPDADPELDAVYGWDPEVSCGSDCPTCSTTITNVATLTCDEDQSLVEGSPAGASFDVECLGDGDGDEAYCSQTQGGWGQGASGNNVGACRDEWFDTVFPGSLIIGDSDGPDADMCYAIELTDAAAVEAFLPTGGTAAALTADLTDPAVSAAGVFAGQLVAATLNAAFSQYNADNGEGSLTCGGGRTFPGGLGDLVFVGGCEIVDDEGNTITVPSCVNGLSLNDVLAQANRAISACPDVGDCSLGDLKDALDALNNNFVDCDTNQGCLVAAP
jgi:hypothetical protein